MKGKKLHLVSLAMIVLVACQKEKIGDIQHLDAVKLNVTISKQSVSSVDPTSKDATSFADNDQIAISDGGEFVTYTLGNNAWQSAVDKFLKWGDSEMTYEAYYPVNSTTSATHFTLPSDQSSKTKLTAADYMTSSGKQKRPESGSQLDLEFNRHTTQVVVRITEFSGEFVGTPAISNLRIHSPHNGYTNTSAIETESMSIIPYAEGSDYSALVVPGKQAITGNFITLTVTDDNEEKQMSINEIPTMMTGRCYIYNLIIGKEQIIVTAVNEEDWGNSEPTTDGETVLVRTFAGAKFEFVYVKGGVTFSMGSPSSETERFDDELQHWVKLSKDYFISRNEITQAQWRAIMGNKGTPGFEGDNYPMENISWDDICTGNNSFLSTINSLSSNVFDLPTEAQWEYAVRGGNKAKSYSKYAGTDTENQLDNYAWYKTNASSSTQQIAGKLANPLGIFDMTGNVWEWCKDSWDESENYPTNTTKESPAIDPVVDKGNQRVLRGGGWNTAAQNARSAARFFYHPQGKNNHTGFRLVLLTQ